MCVCVCVCVYIQIYIYMYICICVCKTIYIYTHAHACTHTYTNKFNFKSQLKYELENEWGRHTMLASDIYMHTCSPCRHILMNPQTYIQQRERERDRDRDRDRETEREWNRKSQKVCEQITSVTSKTGISQPTLPVRLELAFMTLPIYRASSSFQSPWVESLPTPLQSPYVPFRIRLSFFPFLSKHFEETHSDVINDWHNFNPTIAEAFRKSAYNLCYLTTVLMIALQSLTCSHGNGHSERIASSLQFCNTG